MHKRLPLTKFLPSLSGFDDASSCLVGIVMAVLEMHFLSVIG
ncbi:hypothetical protein RED65_11420 [Oceanobacter sp. RED65]|uniref:Uncharacterized protein n=1 Tax=Bermanella marisrubri TaxID=207949 RepID=Q1N1A4_9GAMM|nr:hypothetical protein RED65_11420 [Oceanobacter sp. RED65] [Bermanella marisrubri]